MQGLFLSAHVQFVARACCRYLTQVHSVSLRSVSLV